MENIDRRGFFGTLGALLVAPHFPKSEVTSVLFPMVPTQQTPVIRLEDIRTRRFDIIAREYKTKEF